MSTTGYLELKSGKPIGVEHGFAQACFFLGVLICVSEDSVAWDSGQLPKCYWSPSVSIPLMLPSSFCIFLITLVSLHSFYL